MKLHETAISKTTASQPHTEKEPGLAVGFLFVYEIVCVISL